MYPVSVVHLVWKPLGPEVLARFLDAYRRRPADLPHELAVVLNGFEGDADRAPYEELLADVPHRPIVLPEPVQDLPAYLAAARAVESEYVCFLNSYSEPLAAGWLAKLYAHAARPGVGLVGASGSWESHRTLSADGFQELHQAGTAALALRAFRALRRGRRLTSLVALYGRIWRDTQTAARLYDPFPNPHVRTNGFMLRRDLMLALRWPAIRTKVDALAFESGRDGLTRQVEAMGLDALVVGRDGEGYAPEDWWRSGTYRSGDQQNLLISDNRTRQFGDYAALDAETKARLFAATWGADPASSARSIVRPAAPAPL